MQQIPATSIGSYHSQRSKNRETYPINFPIKVLRAEEDINDTMKVKVEKEEIDKLLRRVREHKRFSFAQDPNIRLDKRNHFNSRNFSVNYATADNKQKYTVNQDMLMQNPVTIKGITK